MLAVAKKLQDKSLFMGLNEIPNAEDAVANDVLYHRVCWVLAQRKAKIEVTSPQELENISQIVADIEIINKVESFLNESADTVMDMKSLNAAYNSLLETNDLNYKRYLKQLLLENVPGVKFVRPHARNQSERICSYYSHSSAIEKSFQNSYDDYNNIFHASKIIRNEIKEQEKWQFNGSYDGFTITKSLELLLRWIIGGPIDANARRTRKPGGLESGEPVTEK